MSTKFFTNEDENTLISKFKGVLEGNNFEYFDALVGYLRSSGYFKVRAFLQDVPKVRILVGINADKLIVEATRKGVDFFSDREKTKEEFIATMLLDIQKANYDEVTENGIIQFFEDFATGKIELKAHPVKTIHAKIYIFYKQIHNQHNTQCSVITGSSNMTDSGLGTKVENNYEFNVQLNDYNDVKFAFDEFEKLWNESEPILKADTQAVLEKSYLRDNFTPYEIYIKMMIEYFGNRVEYDPSNIELLLPEKYLKLKYQTDAASQGYAIMKKHNGFILADVVGLGKTIIALMVIKKFIFDNGSQTRILIVAPPAIESNWKRSAKDFLIENHIEFVTTGSLHKVLDKNNTEISNAERFDLVVVDESHKFRNDYTDAYVALQEICKIKRIKPAEDGDDKKKIILISATPLNNKPEDIQNQLYLFQDKRNSTLEIHNRNLQEYFNPINTKYKELSKQTKLDIPKLKSLFNQLRNDIIEPLVIRRTRKDIENDPEYKEDLNKQGIEFPIYEDPISLHYELDADLSDLFLETIELISGFDDNENPVPHKIGYYRYRAIEFLKTAEHRNIYENRNQSVRSISERLQAIMRTLLVKRLESSFFAFTNSLERLETACTNMISMFEKDTILIAPDFNVNQLLEKGFTDDEIIEKMENKGGNNMVFNADDFDADFPDNLLADKEKISDLVVRWKKVETDPKMDEFIAKLKNTFFDKKMNNAGKLVVFTESTETSQYIKASMEAAGFEKILAVNSKNRKLVANDILLNFDANIAEDSKKYDVIITTEVLAEGVNLHRSNVIINYDVPWNSTKLMQRIGRVNRIGSKAKQIYVYNFYPSSHGDDKIQLKNKALRKLQAFHSSFGEDNKIFSLLEELSESGLHGNKIKEDESEILKYLIELRQFRKNNKTIFDQIANIPNKSRVCREELNLQFNPINFNDGDMIAEDVAKSSITYLKAIEDRGVFCYVSQAGNAKNLGFLDAVKLFKCDTDEVAKPKHDKHFEQVGIANNLFKSDLIQNNLTSISRVDLSPAENKSITNLNFALKNVPTPQKAKQIKSVIEIVKNGAFVGKGLSKKINDFFKSFENLILSNPDLFYQKLFAEIIDDLNLNHNSGDKIVPSKNKIIDPRIVLTVSID